MAFFFLIDFVTLCLVLRTHKRVWGLGFVSNVFSCIFVYGGVIWILDFVVVRWYRLLLRKMGRKKQQSSPSTNVVLKLP